MLKYKLIGKNDISNPQKCIFENRGIKDMEYYQNLDDNCLIPYTKLDNTDKAVQLFLKHINNKSHIILIVDCDADGYTSAAMIYKYIKKISPEAEINYLLHTGKQHGITPDIEIPLVTDKSKGKKLFEDTLLIIPDAGTNDTEQCKLLQEGGIDILILDHHIRDKENPYAVIVNNQISKSYSNKELCGAGVVYKFLQAVDEELWVDYAENFLDLVALGNISDVMDIRSYETKRLIEKGLKAVKNKCFNAFIKGQEYSIGGRLNINAVAFYISPLINAMCRVGTMEEKDILFRAFIETEEKFPCKKQGESEESAETVYEKAVRLCKNAKTRQDNAVKKALPEIKKLIRAKQTYNNAVMFVKCPDALSGVFTGLVAMKLADFYKKPCLLLRKQEDGTYTGSARNFDNSPIPNLKTELSSTENFDYCQGHEGAFGFGIKANKVSETIKKCNEMFKNVEFGTVSVDFDMDFEDLTVGFIRDIDSLKDYYGTGIKPPLVHISNIVLQGTQGIIMGKTESVWKFITDDNIAFVRFMNSEDDTVLNWLKKKGGGRITINALCKISINSFNGVITPQVQIEEYEVV